MTTFSINDEAIDQLIQKIDSFVWTDKDGEIRETLRQQFCHTYNKDRIDNLKTTTNFLE
ncbi:MAG: hypothetical protein E3K37_05925 [Candidatus Kuenenia sp.]|nr:hypothetical protein [Candidatus Kuenenia hertensis]